MVVTRFSPSNTGIMHLGNTRTMLVSFLLAKKVSGEFLVRIEDTDMARSHQQHTDTIMETMSWLGLKSDREITYQTKTQTSGTYEKIANKLLREGFAYYCKCSVQDLKAMKSSQIMTKARLGYTGTCKNLGHGSGVLRLNIKAIAEHFSVQRIPVDDIVLGHRHEDYRNLPDPVLLRSDGTVGYLLANTVDDTLSGVNLIARGSDLYPQTAIQILLRLAISGTTTKYAHLPLMYNENGSKLSKRSDDTKGILQYKAEGYLPNAIIQFALSLGNSSIPTDRALNLQEMIDSYDISFTSGKSTSFVEHKIRYLNKLHIRSADDTVLSDMLLTDYGLLVEPKLVALFKTRASTIIELVESLSFTINAIKNNMGDLQKLAMDNFSAPKCKEFRDKALGGVRTPPLNELLELVA